jgi:hypothetical protein
MTKPIVAAEGKNRENKKIRGGYEKKVEKTKVDDKIALPGD